MYLWSGSLASMSRCTLSSNKVRSCARACAGVRSHARRPQEAIRAAIALPAGTDAQAQTRYNAYNAAVYKMQARLLGDSVRSRVRKIISKLERRLAAASEL